MATPTTFIFWPSCEGTVIKQVILLDPMSIAFIPIVFAIFILLLGSYTLNRLFLDYSSLY